MDLALDPAAIPSSAFAIAYSGGGDSTALLHALARYKPQVFIVDHGLRGGSAAEARAAQDFANSLGLSCDILSWKPPRLTGAVQAKARAARYGLLGQACRARGVTALVTGHTQDDQAETVLMRLSRGSAGSKDAWRGCAGMRLITPAPVWPQLADIDVHRPMLGISRADIRRYLAQHKLPFVDDPSNENEAFSRIRARREIAARPFLRRDMLALAQEMQMGRQAEASRLAAMLEGASIDEFGVARAAMPLSVKALAFLIAGVSGQPSTDMAAAARLCERLGRSDVAAATLGGASLKLLRRSPIETLVISRDPVMASGRSGLSALGAFQTAGRTLWDGRFWIDGSYSAEPALGKLGTLPRALKSALKACPAQARPTLPYVTLNDRLIAVGPYGADGQLSFVVKSAVLPRLKRELSAFWVKPKLMTVSYEK